MARLHLSRFRGRPGPCPLSLRSGPLTGRADAPIVRLRPKGASVPHVPRWTALVVLAWVAWSIPSETAVASHRTPGRGTCPSGWTITPTPLPPKAGDGGFASVAVVAPDDVWAVGWSV